MMRSIEGEGDRVASLCLLRAETVACLPITLTLVRCAPSTSPAPAGEVRWAPLPLRRERFA